MKAIVIYYSFSGKTKQIAEQKAQELNADILEVNEQKKRGILGAYIMGSFSAMRHKKVSLAQDIPNLSGYDRIVIAVPIWAGSPAPAFNVITEHLPGGKDVELILTSGSGNSAKSAVHTKGQVTHRKCRVVSYTDKKTS